MELQKNKKISEMVSDFAGDFISLGEDIQEMQQYLHAASKRLEYCMSG
ncbi:MAG: hypothetical protein U5K27_18510 [Desulfotignum sp.]|nr:hypothetical protein [Desulfotignum sp.]